MAWLGLFGSALLLRAGHLWQIRSTLLAQTLLGDAAAYDAWAQRIAAGDWIGSDVFYQAPLYPYFLAVIYKAAGHHLDVVRAVQIVLGSVSCVLVGLTAQALFSRRAGWIASGLAALCPALLFFDALIQKTVLDVFCFVSALYLLVTATRTSPWRWLASGAAWGALALTRENALVLVPLAMIWAWQHAGWRRAALTLAGLTALLSPVALRNGLISGEFHLTTSQFGPNFYIGNHAGANGTYQPLRVRRGDALFERQDAVDLAEEETGRQLSPGEVSHFWLGKSLTFMREQPGEWLQLMGRKCLLVFNAAELGDTEEQAAYAEHSAVLRLLSHGLHLGVLLPLAALGAVWSWPRHRTLWLLPAVALTYALSVAAFFVFARYRVLLYPPAILGAAAALHDLPSRCRAATSRPTIAGLLASLSIAVFANWPLPESRTEGAITWLNLGNHLVRHGRPEESMAYFDRALARAPATAEALAGKGRALFELNRPAEAIPVLEEALHLDPKLSGAENNLGTALSALGRPGDALPHLERARQLDPKTGEISYNLGNALLQTGKTAEALQAYEEALRLDDSLADAHNNLGSILFQLDRTAEALPHFEKFAALRPAHAGGHSNLGLALRMTGKPREAVGELRAAVSLDPDHAASLGNLAWILATSPDSSLRDGKQALQLATRAAEISEQRNAGVLRIVAAAQAETGDFESARATAQQALDLANQQGDRAFAAVLQRELGTYIARMPLRDER